MRITDELRKFAWKECPSKFLERVTDIADDIEQAHTMELGEVADMFKDCLPLPKDVDEVPIRVGDVVEWVDEPDVSRVVSSIQLAGDGWWVYVGGTGRRPDKHRHHHEPTVEDVLREFGRGWHERMNGPETFDIADYVERYADKLRLAGEDA